MNTNKTFEEYLEENRNQLEQDYIDMYEDEFIEYCKNNFEKQ